MASSLANLAKKKSDPPPPPPPQKIEVKVEEVSQDQETSVLISPTLQDLQEVLTLGESPSDVGVTSAQEADAESGDSSAASSKEEQAPKKKEKAKSPPKKKDRRSKT